VIPGNLPVDPDCNARKLNLTDMQLENLDCALKRFVPVSIDEINCFKLQDRIETNYIVKPEKLPGLLVALSDNYKILFILLLLGLSLASYSQDKDFGLWYEAGVEKSLGKKFEVDGSAMVRTFKDGSTIDQAFLEFSVSWRLIEYFGIAASYRVGNYLDDDDMYHLRHKWFWDLKGYLPAGNFKFSLRMRLQILARTYIDNPSDDREEFDGRLKFKAEYDIPQCPVDLYASFETFTPIFRNSDYLIEKSRSTAGLDYKISKKHVISADYTYDRDNTPHLNIINIISIGYTYKL
jgi:hypothetical protein